MKLVLSFYLYTGSRDPSQVVRLAQQAMSHWSISRFLIDAILKYWALSSVSLQLLKIIQQKEDSKIGTRMFWL